jgi:DNA-binding transcriptional MerR regulator
MRGMSIGEVARKMGLRSSAIRYYEKLGLIPKAPRLSGRRRYDERVLERLAMVRFAKHVGFSIAEIKVLLRGVDGRPPPERWRKPNDPTIAVRNAGLSVSEIGGTRSCLAGRNRTSSGAPEASPIDSFRLSAGVG